jgi:hypothetical protein
VLLRVTALHDEQHITMTLIQVRIKEGRGLLHPDIFAEDRLLFLPPAVSVLLVLFNRNHNVCPLYYFIYSY